MTIERHEGRNQVVCGHCPASMPETYLDEDFRLMIDAARAAGWRVRKVEAARAGASDRDTRDLFGRAPSIAGTAKPQSWTHTCPACAASRRGSLL